MNEPKNPSTRGGWQEAVDAANFLLLVHSARLYGLISGGPQIDVERCEEILRLGRDRGIVPQPRK